MEICSYSILGTMKLKTCELLEGYWHMDLLMQFKENYLRETIYNLIAQPNSVTGCNLPTLWLWKLHFFYGSYFPRQ